MDEKMRSHDDMTPHPDADRLFDLAAGLVGQGDDPSLVEHLRTCESCAAAFRQLVVDVEKGRAAAVRLDTLREEPDGTGARSEVALDVEPHGAEARSEESRGKVVRFPRFLVPAGVLAAAAGLLALLFTARDGTEPRIVAGIEVPALPGPAGMRTLRGEPAGEDLGAGFDAYARGDLDEAARLLDAYSDSEQTDLTRRIYLGNCLVRLGRGAEAARTLEGLPLESLPEPWRGEARWTLYAALTLDGQMARADSLLATLAGETGPVAERARARARQRKPTG